ncbi:hypothetical protein PFISCL1PPCAC_26277, partial [Pristionchus fissidentatus]
RIRDSERWSVTGSICIWEMVFPIRASRVTGSATTTATVIDNTVDNRFMVDHRGLFSSPLVVFI